MPTLEWIGKSKVINHHQKVPFRVLERKYSFDENGQHSEDNGSENMIIRGDNLEALKALLPRYEGRVKCIYIDPPYNTGNEGWVYNDNVNDPKIKKWLGEVVGKEGEDLTRHDKWLCMMYPRLKLLQKLLADDGVIFISIDEIEHRYLELVMDEIFGSANRIDTFVWQNNYGGGAKSNYVVHLHEYVLCFAKNISTVGKIELPPDDNILKYYKYKDEKFDTRGPYRLQPLATTSMDDRPNLRYPLFYEGHEVWPAKQWFWSKERALEAQAKAFRNSPSLHHCQVFGIIDRDYRSDYEIEKYKNDGIYALKVAEVENLFLVEELIRLIADHLGQSPDESFAPIREYVIHTRFAHQIDRQICQSVVAHLKYQLTAIELSKKNDDEAKNSLNVALRNIDYEKTKAEEESKFRSALCEEDYAKVLSVFNEKGLTSSIGHFLGLVDKEYCKRILALLNGKMRNEISDAISTYLPPEIPR